jgi:hypothetical protein
MDEVTGSRVFLHTVVVVSDELDLTDNYEVVGNGELYDHMKKRRDEIVESGHFLKYPKGDPDFMTKSRKLERSKYLT